MQTRHVEISTYPWRGYVEISTYPLQTIFLINELNVDPKQFGEVCGVREDKVSAVKISEANVMKI